GSRSPPRSGGHGRVVPGRPGRPQRGPGGRRRTRPALAPQAVAVHSRGSPAYAAEPPSAWSRTRRGALRSAVRSSAAGVSIPAQFPPPGLEAVAVARTRSIEDDLPAPPHSDRIDVDAAPLVAGVAGVGPPQRGGPGGQRRTRLDPPPTGAARDGPVARPAAPVGAHPQPDRLPPPAVAGRL